MKVAIVCDWLTNVGGAEKVLLEIHRMYPKAPIYTSQYNPKGIDWFKKADVRTGWLQRFPAGMRRFLGPLRQRWFSKLDLSEYDLVISVTGAEAKAVRVPNGVHICYCHVPTQYYWQMYDDYVKNPGFGVLNPVVRCFFKLLVRPLREADYEAAQRPDYFVTISEYARGLIAKYYKREAAVIHPPVEISTFERSTGPDDMSRSRLRPSSRKTAPQRATQDLSQMATDYYIITSRQVNWKRIDLAIKACVKLGRKLLVVGEGPEHGKLVAMAGDSGVVEFLPLQKKEELAELLAGAKGYLFPSLEPFGIAPVEALASGCPVIAYGEGGALDYVVDGENGVLFEKQTVKAVMRAIERFEKMEFDVKKVVKSAEKFGVERFEKEIKAFVDEKIK